MVPDETGVANLFQEVSEGKKYKNTFSINAALTSARKVRNPQMLSSKSTRRGESLVIVKQIKTMICISYG